MNSGRPMLREEPPELQARALDHLRYIRRTMEDAGSFTMVPGWGQVAVGVTALAAAVIASFQPTHEAWLATWMIEALVALALAIWTMARKARAAGMPLFAGPARKFAVTFSLPLLAGAVLTAALERAGATTVLPGAWLLMFGTAVAAGGLFSVPIVPVMGVSFMGLGAVALLAPPTWADGFMAAGFGVLMIGFGIAIARRHGG